MAQNALIATEDTGVVAQAEAILNQSGFTCYHAKTPVGAADIAREKLPEVAFIDFDLPGIDLTRKISDYYGLSTRIALFCPKEKIARASKAMGSNGADSVIPKPLEKRDFQTTIQNAPSAVEFTGSHRVTFVSRDQNNEYQTSHGTARYVQSDDRSIVAVSGEDIPDWVGENDHVIVGKRGTLTDSFTVEGYLEMSDTHKRFSPFTIFYHN